MRKLILTSLLTALAIGCLSQKSTSEEYIKPHKVYIIHGLLGNRAEYTRMQKELRASNFDPIFFSYKSRTTTLLEASRQLYEQIKSDAPESFSLVTHSLGGLVARGLLSYIEQDPHFPKIKRVVMIAPPNKGTVVGNYIYRYSLLRWILGVNLRDVMNDEESLALRLPTKFDAEVGIVAGIRGREPGYNPYIEGDNDGEIRPEETRLGTEDDFITVRANHISILRKKETIEQTLQFLKNGSCRFNLESYKGGK